MHTYRFPLITIRDDKTFLEKQFNAMNHIHNVVVKHAVKLLKHLQNCREYQILQAEYNKLNKIKEPCDADEKRKKQFSKEMSAYRKDIGLTSAGLQSHAKVCGKQFSHLVSSQQVQMECSRVYNGVEKILFGKGQKLHYKKSWEQMTVAGKTNTNGAKFNYDTCTVQWMNHTYKCKLPRKLKDIAYMAESLDHKLCYCVISRKMFNSGWRYYVILYLEGNAPGKHDEPVKNNPAAKASIGIDPGVSTIAGYGDNGPILEELAPKTAAYEKQIHEVQQKMDRSRRASNPERYNENGTVKRQPKRANGKKPKYKPWKASKRYIKYRRLLQVLNRKKAAYTRQCHEEVANKVTSMADYIIVEHMDYAALARRSRKTERQDTVSAVTQKNGETQQVRKYKRKKRFGHSIGSRAPSELLTILKRKCNQYGKVYAETNTQTFKASQYDHVKDEYIKVPLSQREKEVGGHKVQRDLYSAFLNWNADKTLEHADRDKCLATFDTFVKKQTEYIEALKTNHVTMKQCFGF